VRVPVPGTGVFSTVLALLGTGVWLLAGTPVPKVAKTVENTPVPAQAGTALIAGVVVDGATGRPIPGALVSLNSRELPNVFADALGRFVFPGVRPGSYEPGASKPGYAVSESDGRRGRIAVSDGQRSVDVRIKLWRLASVNGRVTDDRGDPVVRAEVVALRWLSTGDSSAPSRVAFARTDDRGVYRLFDLPPGDYLIGAGRKDLPTIGDIVALSAPTTAVVAPRSSKSVAPLSRDQADSAVSVFPPRFYASAQTYRDAMTVALAPGDDRLGIDIALVARPVVRVSGSIITDGAPVKLSANEFVLTPVIDGKLSFGLASYVLETLEPNGGFAFDAVPHGTYQLNVLSADAAELADRLPYWATLPVTVTGDGVDGLQLVLRPGLRLSGSLSFVPGARPASEAIVGSLGLTFWPIDTPATLGGARIEADGSFAVRVVPGRYWVDIQSAANGLHVKSLTVSGIDLTDLPVDVGNEPLQGMQVTVAGLADYAAIKGTVRQMAGSQDDSSVLLFPADRRLWPEPRAASRRFRVAETGASGAFAFAEIVPGEYLLAATDSPPGNWRTVSRLDALARGATRIFVLPGESRVVAVTR